MNKNKRFPDWVGECLLDDAFPWQHGIKITMETFLANYTLHDSYWMGLYIQPDYAYTALIQWDTFWTNSRVPYGEEVGSRAFPLLVIYFDRIYQVLTSNPSHFSTGVIGHAESKSVSDEHRTAMFDSWNQLPTIPNATKHGLIEEQLFQTVFYPAVGGQLDVLHAGDTRFLCLDWEGNALPIPI